MDGPGTAYLFFYDKQSHIGLKQDVAENLQTYVAEVFSEWISQSAHFIVILLLLAEGWRGPWPHWIGSIKDPGWSIGTILCPT